MVKRKKKNAVTLLSLLFLLIVLISGYVWYSNWNKTTKEQGDNMEEDTNQEDLVLGSIDIDQLSSMHYIAQDADLTLIMEDGIWKSKEDPKRPINQENVTKMIDVLDEVKAKQLVNEAPEDLSEYGLSKPAAYIKAIQTDKTTLTLQIGDEVIGGEGYYALVNEENKVYLLESSYGIGLQYRDNDMTQLEEGPSITAEDIQHIEIIKRDEDNLELFFDSDNELDYSKSGLNPWMILQPYENGYTADLSKVNELLPNYSSFDFLACVNYDSNDLKLYGLADPMASIKIEYMETRTETLDEPDVDPDTGEEITEKTDQEKKNYMIFIGNKDEEGNYYVKTENSNAVYTMSEVSINKMLQVNAADLVSPLILMPNIDIVDKINVEIEGVTYTMEIKRNTVENDEGKEEITATYYHNGAVVEEEVFKDIYQSMIAASYDTEIKEDIATAGVEPFLTISYHIYKEKETTLSVSFLPYNESFYVVDTGTTPNFFADKRAIDEIATTIKNFGGIEN